MKQLAVPPVYTYALPRLCASKGCLKDRDIGREYCAVCRRKPKPKYLQSTNLPEGMTYIYFIQTEGGGDLIKIGKSRNVKSRLHSMQTGCPIPMRLLGYFKANDSMEGALHDEFAEYRVRGEWFEPVEDIKNFLLAYKLKGRLIN